MQRWSRSWLPLGIGAEPFPHSVSVAGASIIPALCVHGAPVIMESPTGVGSVETADVDIASGTTQ